MIPKYLYSKKSCTLCDNTLTKLQLICVLYLQHKCRTRIRRIFPLPKDTMLCILAIYGDLKYYASFIDFISMSENSSNFMTLFE